MTPTESLQRTREARNLVGTALREAGARAGAAGLLAAYSISDWKFNDAGELTNLAELVTALKSNFPEQFKTEAA